MKTWLHLCGLFCCINTIFAIPVPVHAAPPRQDGMATLQLENQSDQSLAICDIFAVRIPSEIVLDLQEQIDLPPSAYRQLSVPPGRYRLLVTDCEQNILVQQQDIPITGLFVLPLASPTSPTPLSMQSRPAATGEVTLQIRNKTKQTVCYVYISPITATEWGEDRLGKHTIAPDETYKFALVPGDYDLLLQDCDSNVLLDKRRLTIDQERELSLTQADISATACDASKQSGILAYQRGQYEVALATFQSTLTCYRQVGDRAGEGTILSNIGLVYHSQGRYGEALVSYEEALAILQAVSDRSGEGTTLNNIGGVYDDQGRYGEALANYEQALAIQREVGDRVGEGATLNNIGAVYDAQGQYDAALASYEQALAIRHEVGDRAGEGTTLHNIGGVYNDQGRYGEALASYEQALVLRHEVGDRVGEGRTLTNIGAVYNNQGRYGEALTSYGQALAVLQAVGDRAGEGTILNNIGTVYHRQGRYGEALASFEQALAIRRAVGDRAGEGTTLNNIGGVYHAQGRYGEALANYEQALAIQCEVGDRAGEGATLNNIGLVYRNRGRFGEALASYEQALAILQKVGDRASEAATLINIGELYHVQGRYDGALASYERALAILQKVGDRASEAATIINIGVVYNAQRRYGGALASFEQALAIMQAIGDRAGEGATLINIGAVYGNQGQYDEALASFEQALAILQAIDDPAAEGSTHHNIGAVYHAQGRYGEALSNFEQALSIRQTIGDRAGEGATLTNIGEVYRNQGRYDEALASYIDGLNTLEDVRMGAGNDQARISFAEGYTDAYDQVIALSYQQAAEAQAFWYSERGRARVLLDTIATGQVQLNDNEAASLLAAEQEAYAVRQSAQDVLAKARAANPSDPVWTSEAEQALKEAEAAYQKVSDEISARSDQLASLISGRQQVPQLADVQALLDKDTTLLSYWMLADKTLAFLITAHHISVIELPDATSDNVSTALRDLYGWSNKENPHPRPLRSLYQWLIEPLTPHLTTPHVAIIPHRWLHYVPFAALTNGKVYLGQQHTLSLLPSASVLPFLAQNAANVKNAVTPTALVFGNPQTDLPVLPAAETEATAVANLLHTAVYTGTAASELALHAMISETTILHLAAHGSYSPTNALASAIYLAPVRPLTATQPLTQTAGVASVDTTRDGQLETREIFGLPLQGTDLVTLSACQTSIGELSLGDDIVGLTRAFFFAGSPTVIASLWSVDDAATETLMVSFYRHWLQDGLSKAESLQTAQAEVRANPRWASPFYWAGFVLNGDPGRVASVK